MNQTQITWLGQSFIKIIAPNGKIIFIDPWKDFPPGNNLFPADYPILDADLILVTHGHLDHLGDTVKLTLRPDAKPDLKVVTNFDLMLNLMEQGVPNEKFQAINIGGSVSFDGIRITMVQAVHSSGVGHFGPKHLTGGGTASGFVITLPEGLTIYHAGDTDIFSDLKLIGEIYHPSVAFVPIGDIFTMGPANAALSVSYIKPDIAVPIHYGGTFGLPGKPADFAEMVAKLTGGSVKTKIMTPGAGELF